MMKLYITPGSPYARMARIVVLEKGLEKRVEIIAAQTRTTDSPYYGINPSGRVPYLIRDDGVGFDAAAALEKASGLGLHGMQERAALLGGSVAIESRRGHGTTIRARIHVPD